MLVFLFSLTLGLGILVSLKLYEFLKIEGLEAVSISFSQFLSNFVLALFLVGVVFLFGRKFEKGKKYLLKGLFLIATGLGSLVSLGVFIGDSSIVLVLAIALWWLIKPNVFIHDTLVILGMAGAGSLLGTRLGPETVVLLLIVFSIYDYIAVYKTKHMVIMAKEMVKEGAILGLVLPQTLSDFKASLKEVVPGKGRFFVLGGGDVVFPLTLCSSVLTRGLEDALVVAVFALAGLFTSFVIFSRQQTRQPIPALPPIALFSIIGYLLTLIYPVK